MEPSPTPRFQSPRGLSRPAEALPSPRLPPERVSFAEVCAVVVCYRPDESAFECIRTILEGAAHTIIVANSPEPALRALGSADVTLVENSENVGVAAALNQGIREARRQDYRWVLLFDQDTRIFPASIVELLDVLNDCLVEEGDRLALLGTNYFHGLADGSVADAGVPFCPERSWIERDLVITSGTLVSLRSFAAIGCFAEDFFVDHVDHEYCLRARRMGYVVARTVWPLMVHRIGMARRRASRGGAGLREVVNDYSALRRYYQIRNFLRLSREYGREFPGSIALLRKTAGRETSRMLLHERGRLLKIAALAIAAIHARRGLSGKYPGRLLLR
jgi:rhamnosyltransferase